jgi:putative AlgH/UPF0301 family transcriptional regulator
LKPVSCKNDLSLPFEAFAPVRLFSQMQRHQQLLIALERMSNRSFSEKTALVMKHLVNFGNAAMGCVAKHVVKLNLIRRAMEQFEEITTTRSSFSLAREKRRMVSWQQKLS